MRAYLSSEHEYRCFVFNGLAEGVWPLSVLRQLRPRPDRKLVVVDMVLAMPTTRRDWVRVAFRRQLMRGVDLFLHYAKNSSGLREIYRIPESHFLYVPFKVNDWDRIQTMHPTDEGYIVVAGQTRRDFRTFLSAIEHLPVPVRIVAREDEVLSKHASSLPAEGWPSHVTFVRDADDRESFLAQLAGARLVVLPILPHNITPSGISICLVSMALGKCVILTRGPVTDGLVDQGEAIVVPPSDPVALRNAIAAAWEDEELRAATASRGRAYAEKLGGEERLYKDILEATLGLCETPRGACAPVK
jgi:glycosyltransferase involved in cell wall biosynthesis